MDDVEIPKFFICPISLQIMKDPVTAVTGITYDRESIEHWQSHGRSNVCPVTNQPLPPGSALTPNHTLRRLIQSWCTSIGIDQIPSAPINPPLKKSLVRSLLKNINQETLQKLENLAVAAAESGGKDNTDKICLQEAGVTATMWHFIEGCHKKGGTLIGLKEALKVLFLVGIEPDQMSSLSEENEQIIDSLTWILGLDQNEVCNKESFKIHAILLLKSFIDKANPSVLERLKPSLIEKLVHVLKERGNASQTKAVLDIMLSSCPYGRNRVSMVESGAVYELIELGLNCPDKSIMESMLGVLVHLCSCADGRDQLLSHAAGLALVSRKLLKVSPKADDRIMLILSLMSKFSATNGVLQEMLRLGTVSKLCMVLQHDRASYLKEKAREILRRHYDVWKKTDCIKVSVGTKFSR